jgi:hypothetical protein
MNGDRLWMEEDELRVELEVVEARLFFAVVAVGVLLDRIEGAARDGYVAGYSDAALRMSSAVEVGNAGCVALH